MKNYFRPTLAAVSAILSTAFCYWQNNGIETNEIQYNNPKIPKSFQGFKILHISDLHNKSFGKEHCKIIKKIEKASPDIIVITGDIINKRNPKINVAMDFIESAITFAPIYFVSGNHEHWINGYSELMDRLKAVGVNVLENKSCEICYKGEKITIMGLIDYASNYIFIEKLEDFIEGSKTKFNILLSHRPEHFKIYADSGVDIVFTGHAHGGQIRIPFFGALVAPDQGIFPKYTSGRYLQNKTTMIVSRGLGSSIIPQRIFNRPELILVKLGTKI